MKRAVTLDDAAHAVASGEPIEQRAERLTKKYGCKHCGLIGCKCNDVEDTFAASVCKKCRASPCECEGKPVPRTVGGVCNVCRRSAALCICVSHYPVKSVVDPTVRPQHDREQRPYSEPYLARLVNEGMNHYYSRDADGLARWLKSHLR